MHRTVPLGLTVLPKYFQFPLLGIFPCTSSTPTPLSCTVKTFNSRYLGFFHAPVMRHIHQLGLADFQFPLLGIFPCTMNNSGSPLLSPIKLSIPVTWDFSMHPVHILTEAYREKHLSIPVTWDFSMHRQC